MRGLVDRKTGLKMGVLQPTGWCLGICDYCRRSGPGLSSQRVGGQLQVPAALPHQVHQAGKQGDGAQRARVAQQQQLKLGARDGHVDAPPVLQQLACGEREGWQGKADSDGVGHQVGAVEGMASGATHTQCVQPVATTQQA